MLSLKVIDEKRNRVIIYDYVLQLKSFNKGIKIWCADNFSTIIRFNEFTKIEIEKEYI